MTDENPECCVIMVEANTHQPHVFPQILILKISTAACLASGNTKSEKIVCLQMLIYNYSSGGSLQDRIGEDSHHIISYKVV